MRIADTVSRHTTWLLLCALPLSALGSGILPYTPITNGNDQDETPLVFHGASVAVYDPLEFTEPSLSSPSDEKTLKVTSAGVPTIPATTTITHKQTPSEPITQNLLANAGLSLGAIALSATLDRSGDRFAQDHGSGKAIKGLTHVGNALPFIAFGLAGLALLDDDPRLSRTGYSALQAGGFGALGGLGLKTIFARARPEENLGPSDFNSKTIKRGDSSMPSIHSAMIWGVVTPFAKEYDQPWLYGVASLTNLARIADRKHWVSDTVAGGLLGYWLGDIAWHRNRRDDDKYRTQLYFDGKQVAVGWSFQ